ncbi:hypothetical protein C6A36_00195 [Desulfobacteraceae bacterium SEEP-SAG10]|nr:hypothetical protein C6A36_00195 [Desulfobacteraceae bacterium SEEP-SAG10]
MKKLIYLMGTDGAGKTTLSHGLLRKLSEDGKKVKYLYARYYPILAYPFKIISRLVLYKENTQYKNYKRYSQLKTNYNRKHKVLARVYAILCIIDYFVFAYLKVMYKYIFADYIIVDRYVGDFVVTLSIASGLKEYEMLFLLKLFHYFFPPPTLSFFIYVDEDVAFQRKDDIPSVMYLKERKLKYFILRNFYRFKIIDGHKSQKKISENVYIMINENRVESDKASKGV